jgi:hypothetical protein
VEIALASRDPERRMGGYKPHPHDTHDFTDAISHILETHAVTWDAVCSSSRFTDACAARVMVSRLYFSFGLKPFEVSRRTGIDASTLRYHWRAMNTETERQEEPVFSHAITCVKHK